MPDAYFVCIEYGHWMIFLISLAMDIGLFAPLIVTFTFGLWLLVVVLVLLLLDPPPICFPLPLVDVPFLTVPPDLLANPKLLAACALAAAYRASMSSSALPPAS